MLVGGPNVENFRIAISTLALGASKWVEKFCYVRYSGRNLKSVHFRRFGPSRIYTHVYCSLKDSKFGKGKRRLVTHTVGPEERI